MEGCKHKAVYRLDELPECACGATMDADGVWQQEYDPDLDYSARDWSEESPS